MAVKSSQHLCVPTALCLTFTVACSSIELDPPQALHAPPNAWLGVDVEDVRQDQTAEDTWWEITADPVLVRLIDSVRRDSPSVIEAAARLEEAEAVRAVEQAVGRPSLSVGASRFSDLGGDAPDRWELGTDIAVSPGRFGRVEHRRAAADAEQRSAIYSQDERILDLQTATVIAYVDLRRAQSQWEVARSSREIQAETLELIELSVRAGTGQDLDLLRASSNLGSIDARLPRLRANEARARLRLRTLLGLDSQRFEDEYAQDLRPRSGVLTVPIPPREAAIGVPADTLLRRPDVLSAYEAVAAQVARTHLAEAERRPRLDMSLLLAFAGPTVAGLLSSENRTEQIGQSVTWSLFEGGRLRAQVRAEEARWGAAVARYEQAALNALEEVEGRLATFLGEHDRLAFLSEAAQDAALSADLASEQYESGRTDFQVVLDSQRTLLDLRDQEVTTRAEVMTQYARLMDALGVGAQSWRIERE